MCALAARVTAGAALALIAASPDVCARSAAARGLRLDVECRVAEILDDPSPRIEAAVEVEGLEPEPALERFLRDLDLECGPAEGPPSEAELRGFRPHLSAAADLIAAARLLGGLPARTPPLPLWATYGCRPRGRP